MLGIRARAHGAADARHVPVDLLYFFLSPRTFHVPREHRALDLERVEVPGGHAHALPAEHAAMDVCVVAAAGRDVRGAQYRAPALAGRERIVVRVIRRVVTEA